MRPNLKTPIPLLLLLAAPGLAGPRPAPRAIADEPLPAASVPEPRPVGSTFKAARPQPATPAPERIAEARPAEDDEADAPDEPAISEEIDKDSAEIEEMRRAEEAAHVAASADKATPDTGKLQLLPQLDVDLATLRARYDIPIDVNDAVVSYIRFFQSQAARKHFVKWLGRSHRYIPRFREILKEEGVPEDTVYLAMIESGFGNFAKSRARAVGNWQFISATGKRFGLAQDFWVDERRDPEKAARAAARYLKELFEQQGDWRLAWAGYNAGGGRITKAKRLGYEDFWDMAATPGKKVLRAETKGYVPKLMAAAIISKHPEAFGFSKAEIDAEAWVPYEEVTVKEATLLSLVARAAGTSEKTIIDLNPELRRACTPPRAYRIKIPKDSAAGFAEAWPKLEGKSRLTFAGHVVKKGDTLSSIALRYGVPTQGILEMNGLRSAKKLRVGTELLVPRPIGSGVATTEAAVAVRARTAAVSRTAEERTTVRVRSGDSLWSISKRLGVELDDLCRWNGIHDPRTRKLQVGEKLVVY
ncbi:MAG: LysM peptidoglycan-binding domain-containing protein [Anaeromyxobacter sp.]